MVVETGDLSVVEGTMINKDDINAKDGSGRAPLHITAYNGKVDVVRNLIGKGAQVNIKTKHDRTPLHFAVGPCSNFETVKTLVENGAEIDAQDKGGISPLHLAAYSGNLDVVRYLIEREGQVNVKDKHKRLPLHLAISGAGDFETVKILVENGSEIDTREACGCTPLHLAVLRGSLEITKCLLEHGADATLKMNKGLNVIEVAKRENNAVVAAEVTKLVRSYAEKREVEDTVKATVTSIERIVDVDSELQPWVRRAAGGDREKRRIV